MLTTTPFDDLPLTTASEVWSLCAVIYAYWTGTYPISTKTTPQSTPELAAGHWEPWETTRPRPFLRSRSFIASVLRLDPA